MRILTNRKKRRAGTRPALLIPDTITDTDVRIPLGLHLLISGTTGSGKTNLLLAILSTLICHVEAGDVCLLAVDLKDGVSANAVKNLYTSIAGTIEETVVLLQEVRSLITARNQWLKENGLSLFGVGEWVGGGGAGRVVWGYGYHVVVHRRPATA